MVKGKGKKKKNAEEHVDVHDVWVDFSKEIGGRIEDIMKEGASEYKELYKIWGEYAQKMTKQMGKSDPEDRLAFEDIQKMWTEYSSKIGQRFIDILKKENGPLMDLYQFWTEYSGKMSENFSELMGDSIKEQEDLYGRWMDSFSVKERNLDNDVLAAFKNMNQFWQVMLEQSQGMLSPNFGGNIDFNANYKEQNEFWTKKYSEMVMNMMRSSAFAKMNGNVLDGNLEIKRFNDQLISQYMSGMGLPTRENLNDIYQKLTDLDRKISEISRAINSKKGTKKR